MFPYPSPEELAARVQELAGALGAEVREIGRSAWGRPISAVRIPCTDRANAAPPRVICLSQVHGLEWLGPYTGVCFMRALAAGDQPRLEELRRKAEIWMVLCANPDGYEKTYRAMSSNRKLSLGEGRTNGNHVDLNRNFPKPALPPRRGLAGWLSRRSFFGWASGSPDPGSSFYTGLAPASEPETRALMELVASTAPVALLSLHSTMGVFHKPYGISRARRAEYEEACSAFQNAQSSGRYLQIAFGPFDRPTGELEDHVEHASGGTTLAVDVEQYPLWRRPARFLPGRHIFWKFNPEDPERWAQNDVPAIGEFFLEALAQRERSRTA